MTSTDIKTPATDHLDPLDTSAQLGEGATVHETLVLILRELRADRQERDARSIALSRLYDPSASTKGASLPTWLPHLEGSRRRSNELVP